MGNHFKLHSNAYHQQSRGIKTSTIVFINGASCSGKSTLASRLAQSMGARVLHADDYLNFELFEDETRCPMHIVDGRKWKNWEAASSMRWGALENAIEDEKREGGLVFVEGFLLFVEPTILSLADAIIQINIDKEECWKRRHSRAQEMQNLPKKAGVGDTNYEIIEVYTKDDDEMREKIRIEALKQFPDDGNLAWLHLYFEDVLWPLAVQYHSTPPEGSMIVDPENFPKDKEEWLTTVEEQFRTFLEVKQALERKQSDV